MKGSDKDGEHGWEALLGSRARRRVTVVLAGK